MIKSFVRLLAVPKGFNPDGLLTLFLNPGFAKSPGMSSQRIAYFEKSHSSRSHVLLLKLYGWILHSLLLAKYIG
jgi:hypothetical protein